MATQITEYNQQIYPQISKLEDNCIIAKIANQPNYLNIHDLQSEKMGKKILSQPYPNSR